MEKIKLGPQTLLYPMPAVLVGAQVNGTPNFMTVAWCGIAAFKPAAIAVAIHKKRYTLKGIMENKTFSVNVPSTNMVKETDYCALPACSRCSCNIDVESFLLNIQPKFQGFNCTVLSIYLLQWR